MIGEKLRFGILSPSIKQQLKDEGITMPEKQLEKWEEIRTCIKKLEGYGYMTEKQAKASFDQLRKMICLQVSRRG